MRKSIIILASIAFLSILTLSPTITGQVFAQTQMDQPVIPPRQQWKMANDISELTCKEGLVLMTKANGAPACVSPNAFFRLVDRGWGQFDNSLYVNRPQMMQNMMGYMVRDPGLMQPMHTMMLQNQQQVQDMSSLWYEKAKQDPQVFRNFMMPIMNNTDLRQQMIDQMMNHQQMMQTMRGNNQMMNMMKGGPMMGQGQMMGDHMMGKGMMGGQMGKAMMAQPLVERPMMMRNPDTMNNMMNRMMQNPELMQQMQDMMLQNPYHMQRMMGPHMSSEIGPAMNPMIGPMMNDPELREQMLELMMQHQQMMQELMQNQEFMKRMNFPTPTNSELGINADKLLSEINKDSSLLLLDIRDIEQFEQGHIEGAASATCDPDKKEKVISRIPKTIKVILIDDDGSESPEITQLMSSAGLDVHYLTGGMKSWNYETVTDDGSMPISPSELWDKLQQNEDVFLLDVRTPEEFAEYHIDGSVNIPLDEIFDPERVAEIPTDKEIIVICKSGVRATVASFALSRHEIDNQVLEGGILAWKDFVGSQ